MKKIIRNTLIFLFIYVLIDSCVILKTDNINPCNQNSPYKDPMECAKWKKNYPKEYNKYIKRTTKEPKGN